MRFSTLILYKFLIKLMLKLNYTAIQHAMSTVYYTICFNNEVNPAGTHC